MRFLECPEKDVFIWNCDDPFEQYYVQQSFEILHANYTNYQGILHHHARKGENRFDAQKIAKKLRQCRSILKKAEVKYFDDYHDGLSVFEGAHFYKGTPFCFIDPPYYKQGSRLYQHSFNDKDHVHLSDQLRDINYHHKNLWMLAYDNHPRILELYDWATIEVHANGKELIITS